MSGFQTIDVEAEASVITAVLSDPEALVELNGRLAAEDFGTPAHAAVFAAALHCEASGHAVDRVTIGDWLEKHRKLPDIVSPERLDELFTNTADTLNLQAHAEVVRDRALKRQVYRAARSMAEKAGSAEVSGQESVSVAEQEILKLGERGPGASELIAVGDSLNHLITDLRDTERKDLLGASTGFPEVDAKTSGLQTGQLAILAARPGLGKTTMALQMGLKVAETTGERVLILSHEMTHTELSARLLSMYLNVSLRDLRSGKALAEDEDRVLEAVEKISETPLEIIDAPPRDVNGLRSLVRRQARREPIGAVIVDYVQMMDERSTNRNRSDVLGEIVYGMKSLAKEVECPFLVLSQLNRGLENRVDKRPNSSDLRESGALEQAADIIWFLHRPAATDPQADPSEAEMFMTKQRNGEANLSFKLRWNTRCARYEPPSSLPSTLHQGAAPAEDELPDDF